MIEFEIDVSGEDILSKNYTICVADKKGKVKGFKFSQELINILCSRHGEGKYRYKSSKQEKSYFRVRLYCIVVYFIIKEFVTNNKDRELILNLCKDFQGHEKDITSNLKAFLENKLGLKVVFHYVRLPKDSIADNYAYLMRKDTLNQMESYIKIDLEEIELLLK